MIQFHQQDFLIDPEIALDDILEELDFEESRWPTNPPQASTPPTTPPENEG